MPKKMTLAKLNEMMMWSETADKFLYSEQRSNILLEAGEQYTKRNSKYWNRLRETRYLTQDQKLRITKNHIKKIVGIYKNSILSHAPGVAIVPNNEKETQDQKSAELNSSVWNYAKKHHRLKEKIEDWVDDFVKVGEVCVKIVWNENKGEHVAYDQKLDDQGQPMVDPQTGEPVPGDPVFTGDFDIKRIHGFNLRRPNGIQNMHDAEWLAEVDMLPVKEVKSWVANEPDKMNKITEDSGEHFYVFDGNMHGYDYKKDYTKVTYMYYRPSKDYPQGYYYIFTKGVVLFEGELPYGIFPIIYSGFDSVQTAPRHRSIIKQLRPYQIEVNRCASKIAEHQVTLGDDKLLIQSGTKISQGVNLPGVRAMQYTGKEPVVVEGRSGAQYLDYMDNQIKEMYEVANVSEEMASKSDSNADAFASLFKSLRDKKKFSLYAEKFERFLVDFCELYLTLARHYYDPNFLIPMIGKSEIVNITEFKNTQPLSFQIKLEPRADDLDTQIGKQMVINHSLQYVGNQLEKGDIGRLMRSMPFGNFEEGFEDFTLDYDLATNMILALDRGEQPEPSPYDEPVYIIKRLVHRMRKPDFKDLHPQIQQAYAVYKDFYGEMEVQKQRQLLAAQADFIPTGGPKIKVDFYIPKPGDPDGPGERATLPAEAVNWLVERLAHQGSSQERLKDMNGGAQAEIARKLNDSPREKQVS